MAVKAVKIDSEKLRMIFKFRGQSLSEVSRSMGYEKNFMSHCLGRGSLPETAVLLLKSLMNINRDEIEVKPEPEPIPEVIEPVKVAEPVIDYERLWKLIYTAVYEAVKKARTE